MDTVMPEGNGSVLRDICMVLRSAHYTALLSEQQWRKVEQDRGSDALRKSTQRNIRCHKQVATVPEIGVPRGSNVTQSSRELGWEAFRDRAMAPPVWTQMVSPRGMARVHDPVTGVKLGARELGAQEAKNLCNAKFAMRAVPTRAAELGYAEESDYNKLTRKQRKEATRFTHQFDVVGVTTQPKGTGKSQGVEQVGSSGEAASRGTTDGDEVHPFNQTALQARSTERSRKAKAENELAMQRRRGYGSSANSTSTSCPLHNNRPIYTESAGDGRRATGFTERTAAWAMKEVGQGSG